jgi:hypothetical protein
MGKISRRKPHPRPTTKKPQASLDLPMLLEERGADGESSFSQACARLKLLLVQFAVEDVLIALSVCDLWPPNVSAQVKHQLAFATCLSIPTDVFSTERIDTYGKFAKFARSLIDALPEFPSLEDYWPTDDWGEIRFTDGIDARPSFYGGCVQRIPDFIESMRILYGDGLEECAYLSRAASQTGIKLIPVMSYAPPYRPDLKGIVEVLHRIMKDHQRCDFIPGAIDARRAELELRKFNPNDGIFTTRQFVHYLHTIFTKYNLTADREHRLDAHMKAAGVFPSPAGLWAWGHRMGVGFRRAVPQSELVTSLLFADTARVSRNGVMYAGRHYSNSAVDEQQWSAYARNFGGWDIPCHHYPGSVSRIWTPNVAGQGLLDLKLSDQSTASPALRPRAPAMAGVVVGHSGVGKTVAIHKAFDCYPSQVIVHESFPRLKGTVICANVPSEACVKQREGNDFSLRLTAAD